jgi:hypothetical protein
MSAEPCGWYNYKLTFRLIWVTHKINENHIFNVVRLCSSKNKIFLWKTKIYILDFEST